MNSGLTFNCGQLPVRAVGIHIHTAPAGCCIRILLGYFRVVAVEADFGQEVLCVLPPATQALLFGYDRRRWHREVVRGQWLAEKHIFQNSYPIGSFF